MISQASGPGDLRPEQVRPLEIVDHARPQAGAAYGGVTRKGAPGPPPGGCGAYAGRVPGARRREGPAAVGRRRARWVSGRRS
ncbi:hypothetical protein [Streptomyces sp. NPDC057686]|uniref:hypothetical protein n=1 Tax=Streptomyces sp. NPDC057686 TaxID=3346212 RepID=UPI0036B811F3